MTIEKKAEETILGIVAEALNLNAAGVRRHSWSLVEILKEVGEHEFAGRISGLIAGNEGGKRK